MTFTFSPMRAMVMTHTQAKAQGQKSLGSKVKSGNGQTDGRTEAIVLPAVITRSVTIRLENSQLK